MARKLVAAQGRHRFNSKLWKTRERKAEVVEMAVPLAIALTAAASARRSTFV
jgi:hypothetical protein